MAFTLNTTDQATDYPRKNQAVKAGEELGVPFWVTNSKGEVVHDTTEGAAEYNSDEPDGEDVQSDQEVEEDLVGVSTESGEVQVEKEAEDLIGDVVGDEPKPEPKKEPKAPRVCTKTDPWVSKDGVEHTGQHGEHRVTKNGSYCYPCDRIIAERQKAERKKASA